MIIINYKDKITPIAPLNSSGRTEEHTTELLMIKTFTT
jgi:hypothetical protein